MEVEMELEVDMDVEVPLCLHGNSASQRWSSGLFMSGGDTNAHSVRNKHLQLNQLQDKSCLHPKSSGTIWRSLVLVLILFLMFSCPVLWLFGWFPLETGSSGTGGRCPVGLKEEKGQVCEASEIFLWVDGEGTKGRGEGTELRGQREVGGVRLSLR